MWLVIDLIMSSLVSLYFFLEYKKKKKLEQLFIAIFFVISIIREIISNNYYNTIINGTLNTIQIVLLVASLYLFFQHRKSIPK